MFGLKTTVYRSLLFPKFWLKHVWELTPTANGLTENREFHKQRLKNTRADVSTLCYKEEFFLMEEWTLLRIRDVLRPWCLVSLLTLNHQSGWRSVQRSAEPLIRLHAAVHMSAAAGLRRATPKNLSNSSPRPGLWHLDHAVHTPWGVKHMVRGPKLSR